MARAKPDAVPSDTLRIGVTFRRPGGGLGPTKMKTRISSHAVTGMAPSAEAMNKALRALHERGFETTIRGRMTASIRGTRQQFEQLFGTTLSTFTLSKRRRRSGHSFYFPGPDAPWNPDPQIAQLIDDAYIQWPHIAMTRAPNTSTRPPHATLTREVAGPSAEPPKLDFHHLTVPKQVAELLNALPVHQAGTMGRGVRIAMVDTGFAHAHPFFTSNGFRSSVVLAPGAKNPASDSNGHGTAQSANVFALAPQATFIGVKMDDDETSDDGASLLEAFSEALRHDPHIISLSIAHSLIADDGTQLATLPNNLVALETEIAHAIASGIVVVASAGDGDFAFPSQMKEVISAGGVFVDAAGKRMASNFSSAFTSAIFSGRSVPDVCGLVGMRPHADYIALPVPPGSALDKAGAAHDDTAPNDGWAVLSGTSAAAPQLAGVCALLLERNRSLTPSDIKTLLERSARDVTDGRASPLTGSGGVGLSAGPGPDGATGAGLVDAFAAWKLA